MAFSINIDATPLTCERFFIPGVTGWLDSKSIHTLQLSPGVYGFQTPAGIEASWGFEVTADGTIQYDVAYDVSHSGQPGFLAGRGTSTIRFIGYAITLNAMDLAIEKFNLLHITDWLNARHMHTVRLLPMGYQVVQPTGVVAEAAFRVMLGGTIDYDPSYDVSHSDLPGFLAGRGTSTYTLRGYAVNIDARVLAASRWCLDITDWLAAPQLHTLQLLPGSYRFGQPTGFIPEAAFAVRRNGTVDYAATNDGFLAGRGTNTYTLRGWTIAIDARALAAPQWYLDRITDRLEARQLHTMQLLPGNYRFVQTAGNVPEVAFDVRLDGTVDYAPTSDVFLAGRGTNSFTLRGCPIVFDGTALGTETYALHHITGLLPRGEVHRVSLLPGNYDFFQPSTNVVPDARFEVRLDGTVDYAATSDGFLSGRGTNTYTLKGLPLIVDARALATPRWRIDGSITDWRDTPQPYTVRVLPGNYRFVQQTGEVPEAAFEVRRDGTVDYPATSDGFLAGRGTSTYILRGWAITIDARVLAAPRWCLDITDWLEAPQLHTLQLLPGIYRFGQPMGFIPEASFEVRRNGTVDYAATSDGFLAGRGTSTYILRGYPIIIDASANRGVSLVLKPLGTAIDTVSQTPPTLGLLPQPGLVLELGSTPPKSAGFDLRKDGALVFDEPYPFVEVTGDARHRTIRLTKNELRTKHPCRCPGAGARVPAG